MKVLITGASGFVGSHAVLELESHGHKPVLTTLSHHYVQVFGKRRPAVRCDLRKRLEVEKLVKKTRPDAVLHLAGHARTTDVDSTNSYTESNIVSTMELCRALRQFNSRVIFLLTSTSFVSQAHGSKRNVINEQSPVAPWTAYGFSKLAAEQLVWLHENARFRGYVTRSFNHIGPGQSTDFVCSALAERIARAREGATVPAGNLSVVRDFSDVRDIVRAYRLIIERRPKEKLFVLGSGHGVSIREIVDHLVRIADKNVRVKTVPTLLRAKDPAAIVANPELARKMLGWKCRIPLEQTLKDLYVSTLARLK